MYILRLVATSCGGLMAHPSKAFQAATWGSHRPYPSSICVCACVRARSERWYVRRLGVLGGIVFFSSLARFGTVFGLDCISGFILEAQGIRLLGIPILGWLEFLSGTTQKGTRR
jgi:hypothetical protein